MALPRLVSAVVFDCDGLLLDTESCWSRAEASLFADYGFGFGPAEDLLAMLAAALSSSGLDRFFAVSVAADEVARPKPDPQLYLRAFELLDASPRTGVALEDSATGVAAAKAAGAFLITVPSQPGKRLDGDYTAAALDDASPVEWARTVAHPGDG
ncbi:MAG TPA: HAD family hydrolase [Mycobacterium sp.]|nr:HAD family hydrolase [Mycobacterium sp.]